MNAKRLVATSILVLTAGVTFAALHQGTVQSPRLGAPECDDAAVTAPAIPRVVVTARKDPVQSTETPIARVVVTASRLAAASSISNLGL